jgi:N-acetylglutamate synthase/N-acetylornithine aminotransferase
MMMLHNGEMTTLPRGFRSYVANIGIKDDADDFVVVASDRPVAAAGVLTCRAPPSPMGVSRRSW